MKTKRIVMAALMAALTCVATMIIKIPTPMKGYINLGDCVVLMAGWLLSPAYAFLAAGIGSALADVFSGYMIYVPATFIIKGTMALVAFYVYVLTNKRFRRLPSRLIGGIVSEMIMILGYFVFEGFLYGFISASTNILANTIQGVAGIVIGLILIKTIEGSKIKFD